MCYIPEILRRHRIMGKNRREPCKCGHFHNSKELKASDVWVERPTEWAKITPFGEISIEKPRKNTPKGV
jgi:hypothetical protein